MGVPVLQDNTWVSTINATTTLRNALRLLQWVEFALNASPTTTSSTLDCVFLKYSADKDNSSSTTNATMSARPVETLTELLEDASTVSVKTSNSTMVCAFLNLLVELDNGLMITETATLSILYARPSIHLMDSVLVVSTILSFSMEFAARMDNFIKMDNVSVVLVQLMKLEMMMDAASFSILWAVSDVKMATKKNLTNKDMDFALKNDPLQLFLYL